VSFCEVFTCIALVYWFARLLLPVIEHRDLAKRRNRGSPRLR